MNTKEQIRKRQADRRRKWYNTISEEKRNEVKARMRGYYEQNKSEFTRRQRERRDKIRRAKTANQSDT